MPYASSTKLIRSQVHFGASAREGHYGSTSSVILNMTVATHALLTFESALMTAEQPSHGTHRYSSLSLGTDAIPSYPCTCAPAHSPLTCVSCTQIGCPAIKISILAERVRQGWAIDRLGGCVQKRREEGQAAGYYVAPDKFRPRRHRGVYPCRPRWPRA
jgi:hypothetical protein